MIKRIILWICFILYIFIIFYPMIIFKLVSWWYSFHRARIKPIYNNAQKHLGKKNIYKGPKVQKNHKAENIFAKKTK